MTTITFDTHKVIEKLTQTGYTEQQAKGFIEVLTETSGDLVTKNYLDVKLTEVRSDIKDLRAEMYKALLIHGLIIVGAILGASAII